MAVARPDPKQHTGKMADLTDKLGDGQLAQQQTLIRRLQAYVPHVVAAAIFVGFVSAGAYVVSLGQVDKYSFFGGVIAGAGGAIAADLIKDIRRGF